MGVNMASYVGFSQYGILGSIVVTIGLVLPSLITICIIANFLEKFKEATLVQQIFAGLKPAVVAFIAVATIDIWWLHFLNISLEAVYLSIRIVGIE